MWCCRDDDVDDDDYDNDDDDVVIMTVKTTMISMVNMMITLTNNVDGKNDGAHDREMMIIMVRDVQ